jgi:hypothetical protein
MQMSSHQQVHAVAMHLELEELAGNWSGILELRQRTEQAVAANTATPCVRNERSLLVCALAASETGDLPEAERLAAEAEALGMEGYESVFDPVRMRLALRRGDLEEARRRLPRSMPPPTKNWWRLTTIAARLDGLLPLGDFGKAAEEAARVIVPCTLLDPFGLRAHGYATRDAREVLRAARRFDRLGLAWNAARTRDMLAEPRMQSART